MRIFYQIIIIFLLSTFCFLFSDSADAARLYFSSSSNEYRQGDVFIVDAMLDTEGESVNTAEIAINFDQNQLEIVDMGRGKSILSLFVKNPIYENGSISFIGGIPGGFLGVGNLISLAFSAKGLGISAISFENNSKILISDGKGTPAKIDIENLNIKLSAGESIPAINEWQNEIKDDNAPPEPFEIKIERDQNMFDGKYFIVFFTKDLQTGVDRYEIKEGTAPWKEGNSPYLLENQESNGKISVKAIDKAGNERIAEALFPKIARKFPLWLVFIAASIFILFLPIIILIKFRAKA